jgi:hypothetical protein
MRRKKKERLREEQFWHNFFYFNVPANVNEVPQHLNRVNFRICGVDDYGIGEMAEYVTSVNMLDLDDTAITNQAIETLTKLAAIKELRLKECCGIDAGCIASLNKLTGLVLLHLGGTAITAKDALGLSGLQQLETLLLSSENYEGEEAHFRALKAMLPQCELIVDHKVYE